MSVAHRFTVYAGDIPVGHAATLSEARIRAGSSGEFHCQPTHIVKRLRAYPFTHLETYPLTAARSGGEQPDNGA